MAMSHYNSIPLEDWEWMEWIVKLLVKLIDTLVGTLCSIVKELNCPKHTFYARKP